MLNYKMWDYVIDANPLVAQLPDGINFNTHLSVRTHKKEVISQGELVERIHYADATMDENGSVTYSIPLVKETWAYYRDENGLAYMREQTLAWYFEDGTLDTEHTKVRTKFYDTVSEKRAEFVRRRANCITYLVDKVLYMLVVYAAKTPAEAQTLGTDFFRTIADKQAIYREGDPEPLRNTITAATETWLDTAVGQSTIRQIILSELV